MPSCVLTDRVCPHSQPLENAYIKKINQTCFNTVVETKLRDKLTPVSTRAPAEPATTTATGGHPVALSGCRSIVRAPQPFTFATTPTRQGRDRYRACSSYKNPVCTVARRFQRLTCTDAAQCRCGAIGKRRNKEAAQPAHRPTATPNAQPCRDAETETENEIGTDRLPTVPKRRSIKWASNSTLCSAP